MFLINIDKSLNIMVRIYFQINRLPFWLGFTCLIILDKSVIIMMFLIGFDKSLNIMARIAFSNP